MDIGTTIWIDIGVNIGDNAGMGPGMTAGAETGSGLETGWELWVLNFMKIVLINLILSGDNAIVIALASKNLPLNKRRLAVFWGAFAAIMLRVVLTLVAIQLLQIPYLMTVGSLLLLWIAVKLLQHPGHQQDIKAAQYLGTVVMTIIMADFVMSLDNVLAIAAVAEGDLLLILLGLLMSIPILIWGSELVLGLMDRYPIVIYCGAGLLGFTAGEMMLKDVWTSAIMESLHIVPHLAVPFVFAAMVIVLGQVGQRFQTDR